MKRASNQDLLKLKQLLTSNLSSAQQEEAATIAATKASTPLNEKALNKEKLSISEQIEYLKFKGIEFNLIQENIAEEILNDRTYYYKITAFRKNFYKDQKGKFINVDFALLNDLATIDMHFRYLFIKLSLDIEHNLKSLLIKLITESDEDGYKIVEEYKNFEIDSYKARLIERKKGLSPNELEEKSSKFETIDQKLLESYRSPRDYSFDLTTKRKNKPSIWVLIELMSYGQLYNFIKFYVENKKYKYRELILAEKILLDSKNIRDSAAHSRPILFNLVGPNQFSLDKNKHPKIQIKNYLIDTCKADKGLVENKLRNLKISDISALLYLHDAYVRGSITRAERKKNY